RARDDHEARCRYGSSDDPVQRSGPGFFSPVAAGTARTGGYGMSTQSTADAQSLESRGYAHPEALVTTQWVAEHLNDEGLRILESIEHLLLYDPGHIPGALTIACHADLHDAFSRDYLDPEQFAKLASRLGITPETTVIFYGDKNNWWAT